ncbi:MAG: hypothetical protein WDZ37_05955 [Solirubrobacterales bacterium]
MARSEGWQIMRFEKLGQRLRIALTVLMAGAVGGSGTWLAARRRGRSSGRIAGRVRRRTDRR